MKYLHEKMLQNQSYRNKLKVSESIVVESIVVEDDQNLLSPYLFFHPCILCFLIFIIILAAI